MRDEIVGAIQRNKLEGYIKMLRDGATVTLTGEEAED
jgi:hypothetical protein